MSSTGLTKYAGKRMGNYVHSEMRAVTDVIDLALARELGYEDLLPALEHAYFCVYKPTRRPPGHFAGKPLRVTLRTKVAPVYSSDLVGGTA